MDENKNKNYCSAYLLDDVLRRIIAAGFSEKLYTIVFTKETDCVLEGKRSNAFWSRSKSGLRKEIPNDTKTCNSE